MAQFSGGSNIEIHVENGIIAVMLITLPIRYQGTTRGLMGDYNLNPNDDLIPKGASGNIPVDSSKEEIFEFGNTCTYVRRSNDVMLVRCIIIVYELWVDEFDP